MFEDMTGSVLHFVSATSEALVFHDGDCRADEGYFVAALVNFDDLDALAPNTTYGILSKAESGGFTLELHANALGRPALRFGVYVGGDYVYAETDAGGFDDTASYLIVGCYDGDGFVSLHVDGALAAESTAIQGGVVNNDAPIVLGASPAGSAGASQHHFSGKIQMAQVQHWREHR